MDVFRFAKLPMRANDRTRRYRIVRGESEHVGEIEVGGDAPEGDTVVLVVVGNAVLSDASREGALSAARRFLDELVSGWGLQIAEVPGGNGWEPQPDGAGRFRLEYRVVCASP